MSEDVFKINCRKAKKRDLSLSALVAAATQLVSDGKTGKARELYTIWSAANASDPQCSVALFNNSALATLEGDYAAAEAALRQAIAINPDFLPAYINLGGILERAGAIENAITLWRTAAGRSVTVSGNSVLYVTTALKADHPRPV